MHLLLMFDACGVPRAWVGKPVRQNAGPKWCDHASFTEAELQVDLFALAMERIAAADRARSIPAVVRSFSGRMNPLDDLSTKCRGILGRLLVAYSSTDRPWSLTALVSAPFASATMCSLSACSVTSDSRCR
jgi:hypothetical protein